MVAKGYEFHHTRFEGPDNAWKQRDGPKTQGYTDGRILGSHIHLYFPANLALAERFVAKIGAWDKEAAKALGISPDTLSLQPLQGL